MTSKTASGSKINEVYPFQTMRLDKSRVLSPSYLRHSIGDPSNHLHYCEKRLFGKAVCRRRGTCNAKRISCDLLFGVVLLEDWTLFIFWMIVIAIVVVKATLCGVSTTTVEIISSLVVIIGYSSIVDFA